MNYKILYTSIFIFFSAILLSSCSETDHKKSEQQQSNANSYEEKPKAEGDTTSVTPTTPLTQNKDELAQAALNQVELFKIQDKDLVLGNKDAAVVVIEYSSPTCPHCSYFHKEILPQIRKKYIETGKIAYIFREFVANKQDLDASILGRCYKNEQDPLKLFDVIYISQENWAFNKNYREILGNMGQLAGVTREKYAECLADSVTTMFLVNNARTISTVPGFIGTPAFFVDGKMHKGAYSAEGLSKAIEDALMQKNGNTNKQSNDAAKDTTKIK